MVEDHPSISAKDQWRLHQFGEKVQPGLFLGYALYAGEVSGKETPWSLTLVELEIWTRQKFMLRDSTKKDVIMPKDGEHFKFPIADGTVKLTGRDQVFRKPTWTRDQPKRGEERPKRFFVDRRELNSSSSSR